MKTNNATNEQIRERMGAEATTEDAAKMIEILAARGVADTDDVSDSQWDDMVAKVCAS